MTIERGDIRGPRKYDHDGIRGRAVLGMASLLAAASLGVASFGVASLLATASHAMASLLATASLGMALLWSRRTKRKNHEYHRSSFTIHNHEYTKPHDPNDP